MCVRVCVFLHYALVSFSIFQDSIAMLWDEIFISDFAEPYKICTKSRLAISVDASKRVLATNLKCRECRDEVRVCVCESLWD